MARYMTAGELQELQKKKDIAVIRDYGFKSNAARKLETKEEVQQKEQEKLQQEAAFFKQEGITTPIPVELEMLNVRETNFLWDLRFC